LLVLTTLQHTTKTQWLIPQPPRPQAQTSYPLFRQSYSARYTATL